MFGRIQSTIKAILFLFILFPVLSKAQSDDFDKLGPLKVTVGIHMIDVLQFDLRTGTHTFDFYLQLGLDRPSSAVSLEFINGTPSLMKLLTDDPILKVYRVKALFSENVNFSWYPFLKHKLTFLIEDEDLTQDKLQFIIDKSQIYIDNRLKIPGYDVGACDSEVFPHYYPLFKETYQTYRFNMHLSKSVLSALLDDLLPSLLIVISGLMAFMIIPSYLNERIAITVAALLSIILLHQTSKANLPPLGYLTYLDKFSIINYAVLVIALGESIWVFKLSDTEGQKIARSVDVRSALVIIGSWIALHLYVLLSFGQIAE